MHPRFKTPWVALTLQASLTTLLLLAVGRFQALFSLAIFSGWLFYGLVVSTLFIFRAREPEQPSPYRVHGYPVVPAIFVAAAAVLLVFSFMDQPLHSAIGAAVILAGLPVYEIVKRRNA